MRLGEFVLPDDVALGPDRVYLTSRANANSVDDRIVAVDLKKESKTTVAVSGFHPGMINSVALLGDWLVYADQQDCRCDGPGDVLWRIYALNTRTKTRRLVATSGSYHDPQAPDVSQDANSVSWWIYKRDKPLKSVTWRPTPGPTPRSDSTLRAEVRDGRVIVTDKSRPGTNLVMPWHNAERVIVSGDNVVVITGGGVAFVRTATIVR